MHIDRIFNELWNKIKWKENHKKGKWSNLKKCM